MIGLDSKENRIFLRKTEENDLHFVYESEHSDGNRLFVGQWTVNEHKHALIDEDILHLMVEDKGKGSPVGYVILKGLKSLNKSIELMRIVITDKRKGFGREVLNLLKFYVFKIEKAHRLWLDVRENNGIAYNLYKTVGFQQEGILRECIKFAFIQDMGVYDASRNKGIGRMLMNEIRSWCVGIGIDCIELDVWEFNTDALKFYEKCSFKTLRRRMILDA